MPLNCFGWSLESTVPTEHSFYKSTLLLRCLMSSSCSEIWCVINFDKDVSSEQYELYCKARGWLTIPVSIQQHMLSFSSHSSVKFAGIKILLSEKNESFCVTTHNPFKLHIQVLFLLHRTIHHIKVCLNYDTVKTVARALARSWRHYCNAMLYSKFVVI